jgi:hypothetical protein
VYNLSTTVAPPLWHPLALFPTLSGFGDFEVINKKNFEVLK